MAARRGPSEQIMAGLFAGSPASFCRQNLHCLKVGLYRDVAGATGVAAITPSDAHRTIGVKRDTPPYLD